MAVPLLPIVIAAVVTVVAVKASGDKAAPKAAGPGTSKFWKPISPDVPPGNVFFAISGTTPGPQRLGLRVSQRVAVVLELPLTANPMANPHVLAECEIVTVDPGGGAQPPTYGLRFVRVLNIDSNYRPQTTPGVDPGVAFIVTPLEIAQVAQMTMVDKAAA